MKDRSMLTQDEMIRLQADGHDLIDTAGFRSEEAYVLHLIHSAAYVHAARLAEGRTVLDLGCNTGYGTELLSWSAASVTGVDVSESAVAEATSRHAGSGIEFQVIDGKRLPFDDAAFEVIVSFQVIEHIVNCDNFLAEIRRVLSPGGVVVFTTPNALLRLDPGMKPWNEFHVREFNPTDLNALLEGHFGGVSVLGLFADEPLYSIEANRLMRGREKAREAAGGVSAAAIRERAKRKLPRGVLKAAKAVRDLVVPGPGAGIKDFLARHGVDDFFYREDGLETALDLMAVCSDNEETLKTCHRQLMEARPEKFPGGHGKVVAEINFRAYNHERDYERVGRFLVRTYRTTGNHINWLQPRWEYMHYHPLIRGIDRGSIHIFEAGDEIVGVVHPEHRMGTFYFEMDTAYDALPWAMMQHLDLCDEVDSSGKRSVKVFIDDTDTALQQLAVGMGYEKTDGHEVMTRFDIPDPFPEIVLPPGFRCKSLADDNDLRKVHSVLWRGFGHGDEPPEDELDDRRFMQSAPNFRKDLTIVVEAPDGRFASFCGMWYEPVHRIAYVEPVATDPDFRRMGLGKAVVMEGIRRCGVEGATVAYVGSSLPVYLSIGFKQIYRQSIWQRERRS